MASLALGHVNVFVLGADHAIHWSYGGGNKAWTSYHINAAKNWRHGPISISRVHHEISLFTVDSKRASLHQSNFDLVNMGDLGPWKNLGGEVLGQPAVANRKGTLHIFYVGTDHAIYHKGWDGVLYTPDGVGAYDKLEGDFAHTPTAICTGPDDVSVFAFGREDNALYHYHWQSSSGWSPVEKFPGHWVGSLKAVSENPGSLNVLGLAGGGNLNHLSCKDLKEWQLQTISGTFQSLDAISSAPRTIDLFALGTGKTIFHKELKDGSWGPWEDLKGMIIHPPKAVSHSPGALGLFGVGTDHVLHFKFKHGKPGRLAWSEWYPVGGGGHVFSAAG